MIERRHISEYFEMVDRIDGQRILLDHYRYFKADERKYYAIRHDVDHELGHALEFARREYKAGIQAIYFLLPTATDFDYSDGLAKRCREFIDLGHGIGFHNNVVTTWLRRGGHLENFIAWPLSFFRDKVGCHVKGTSAHGDPMCYRANYLNYEVWADCPFPVRNNFLQQRFSLRHFGLEYEAYFIRRDAYLSDSGGKWQGATGTDIQPFEWGYAANGQDVKDKVIDEFAGMKAGMFQLLVHPIWWELK